MRLNSWARSLSGWLWIIFLIGCLVAASVAIRRIIFEHRNTVVGLSISHSDVRRLAMVGGMEEDKLLSLIKQETGITSIAVSEDTIQSLTEAGTLTFHKGSDILNMTRIGTPAGSFSRLSIHPDKFYIAVDDALLYDSIKQLLTLELGEHSVQGSGNTLEISGEREQLLHIGLGLPANDLKNIPTYGFSIIPRFKPSLKPDASLIRLKFHALDDAPDVHTLIFDDTRILGYPDELPLVASLMKERGLLFGYVEFSDQEGSRRLGSLLSRQSLRVHGISDEELADLSPQAASERYLRAVKERGIRILFLRPYFQEQAPQQVIGFNIGFFKEISQTLSHMGYTIDALEALPIAAYRPPVGLELLLMGLGVSALLLLLILRFYPVSSFVSGSFFIGTLILFALSFWLGFTDILVRFMAFIAAVCAPCFALISQFPPPRRHRHAPDIRQTTLLFFKISGIVFLGTLLIIGLLSDPAYLLGIRQFWGVKLSILLPLFLTGVYFYLDPHRLSSFFHVFRRVLNRPITVSALLAFTVCLILVGIYVLRSGHVTLEVSFTERLFRNSLESFFFIRPRTKEFLVGYPFLMIALYYIDWKIPRRWLWFFAVIGTIGLISSINSFCHFYTPIWVSAYRTLLGMVIGIGVAFLYVSGYRLLKFFMK